MEPKRTYTDEFRSQIVELAETGTRVTELSEQFGLNKSLINNWRRKARSQQSQLGSAAAGAGGDQSAAAELALLRRRVAELELDNEILKKAALILGTNPPVKSRK